MVRGEVINVNICGKWEKDVFKELQLQLFGMNGDGVRRGWRIFFVVRGGSERCYFLLLLENCWENDIGNIQGVNK